MTNGEYIKSPFICPCGCQYRPCQREKRKEARKLKREQRRKAARGRSLVRRGYLQRAQGKASPRRCGKCGEVGHYAPTCRQKGDDNA